jgi:hypothetical protein
MSKIILIGIRDQLQGLLDNYQVMDTAMVPFKTALGSLNDVIETPDAPAVTVQQPVVGTADVIAGVLAGLGNLGDGISAAVLAKVQAPFDAVTSGMSSLADRVTALTPPQPISPQVLAPTADQIAAAQAVMAAAAATTAAEAPTADSTATA